MSASITIKNTSPLGALDVALLRKVVAAGETVTVTKDQAHRLLEQGDVWAPVSKAAKELFDEMNAKPDVEAGHDTPTDTDTPSEDQE